ncbi:hypothetical protein [Lysobacter solisilvae (ex Woo and Kim 2020)]|uniref:Uncharacterized protein n=1 Tax=Agrilutibacter terrestris TaxID=2865112 RepID=A0A7H0FVZ3_9GAMM|nr:hypothetical protein [Lysobacter terrestris]QNP40209.1 hypothetical protein H8B22_12030 [Lysobacter terrestris]
MFTSLTILTLIIGAISANTFVIIHWHKKRPASSSAAYKLARFSFLALILSVVFAFNLFLQTWVSPSDSIAGPLFGTFGVAFLLLAYAALTAFLVYWRRHRHAAA